MSRPPTTKMHAVVNHLVAPALLLTVWCSNSWATTSYDFIEKSSGDILATLDTDGTDPFDHTNVTGLSFTSEGDALFGFGSGTYQGTFASTVSQWTFDGVSGLTTVGGLESIMAGFSPPHSTVFPEAVLTEFQLVVNPISVDRMALFPGTQPEFVIAEGTWQQVPEPSTFTLTLLALLATLGLSFYRRRRRRAF